MPTAAVHAPPAPAPTVFALHASDVVLLCLIAALSAIDVAFATRIPHWRILLATCAGCVAGVLGLAWLRARTGWRVVRWAHDWYLAPCLFLVYKTVHALVTPVFGGRVVDGWLIAADRWLLGNDPTVWLATLARPWLTELLQVAYTSFYFLFLVVGAELYAEPGHARYRTWLLVCAYGFGLSYLAYFALPAVGPRFTLHDFSRTDLELPGLWLTPYLRRFVDAGGSIPPGVPNDVAMASAHRDVFPSGHTMMMLVTMYWCHRFRLRVRWFLYVAGSLVIAGTLYLRYHYVVDLLAGAALAAWSVATTRRVAALVAGRVRTLPLAFRGALPRW